jgi:uncharacterized SAM-binding protein YcdF (DUF218 family)
MSYLRELLSFSFVMPPTIFIVLCLAGSIVGLRRPRLGAVLALPSSLCLYFFAMPAAALWLDQWLSALSSSAGHGADVQAIVIPVEDVSWGNGTDIPDNVGRYTLERLIAGARLYHDLRIPVVVSGGGPEHRPGVSAATLMSNFLEEEMSVPVRFVEPAARNTFQHALYVHQMLLPLGLTKIIIVAQAPDMARLLWSFRRVGFLAIPYPLARPPASELDYQDFLPSTAAFDRSYRALHELLGLAYYQVFY